MPNNMKKYFAKQVNLISNPIKTHTEKIFLLGSQNIFNTLVPLLRGPIGSIASNWVYWALKNK